MYNPTNQLRHTRITGTEKRSFKSELRCIPVIIPTELLLTQVAVKRLLKIVSGIRRWKSFRPVIFHVCGLRGVCPTTS